MNLCLDQTEKKDGGTMYGSENNTETSETTTTTTTTKNYNNKRETLFETSKLKSRIGAAGYKREVMPQVIL